VRLILFLLAVVLVGATDVASGQASARVEVTIDSVRRDPKVRLHNLMEESRWREALDDAFRISINWRVELWRRQALWSTKERQFEFSVVIRREPLLGQYFITYFSANREPATESFRDFGDFVLQLERAIPINHMAPRTSGEFFYVAEVNVSALDEEQFAEMQRFAGAGSEPSRGDAISSFLLRLVGLPSQTLPSARSVRFRIP
jgi:hypothetical protein